MKKKIKKHNPARYGETYDANWIDVQIEILNHIKSWITLSEKKLLTTKNL